MQLGMAEDLASGVMQALGPHCERIEIAGSVRYVIKCKRLTERWLGLKMEPSFGCGSTSS